jgi:hypothetical protein
VYRAAAEAATVMLQNGTVGGCRAGGGVKRKSTRSSQANTHSCILEVVMC